MVATRNGNSKDREKSHFCQSKRSCSGIHINSPRKVSFRLSTLRCCERLLRHWNSLNLYFFSILGYVLYKKIPSRKCVPGMFCIVLQFTTEPWQIYQINQLILKAWTILKSDILWELFWKRRLNIVFERSLNLLPSLKRKNAGNLVFSPILTSHLKLLASH